MSKHHSTLAHVIPLVLALGACGGLEESTQDETTSDALGTGAYAWVWSNSPSGSVGGGYNSSGGGTTIAHPSTGVYQVTFSGLSGSGGNVQVVAEGANANRCKTSGWGVYPSVSIQVRCFTPFGAAVNTNFFAVFASSASGTSQRWAYAWADQPTTVLYFPSAYYQAHNSGEQVIVARVGVGTYRVYMPYLAQGNGNAQVTAYGTGSEHCNLAALGQGYVEVRCYTTDNAAVDTRFTVAYVSDGSLLAPNTQRGLYFHADQTNAAFPYTPARMAITPIASAVRVSKASGGVDHVSMTPTVPVNLAPSASATLVTSYASGVTYCKPAVGTAGAPLDIRCYLRSGSNVYGYGGAQYLAHSVSSAPIFP